MKTHCSFMSFREKELSPAQSAVEEDEGGFVTSAIRHSHVRPCCDMQELK